MLPIHRLEDDLTFDVAIEDERRWSRYRAVDASTDFATSRSRSLRASVAPSMDRSTAPLLTIRETDAGKPSATGRAKG